LRAGLTKRCREWKSSFGLIPVLFWYQQNAGWVFLAARQYDRAIQKFEEVISKEPSSWLRLAHFLVTAYREKGDYSKAIQVEEKAASLEGEDLDQVKAKYKDLREAYGRDGPIGYWRQQLEWSKNDENNPMGLALLYARVGDKDEAFRYLNLAFERTPIELAGAINENAGFDSLRRDGRFQEMLNRLGLGK